MFPPLRLNPLHCGAVVASRVFAGVHYMVYCVSIPFIAGQWSLPAVWRAWRAEEQASQSPSLRGSGRFHAPLRRARRIIDDVSIPFISGQWSLPGGGGRPHQRVDVSIPFIAGQWSLQKKVIAPAAWRRGSQSPSLRGSGRFDPGYCR